MSSNLRIKKICQFCYAEFIAKTTKTKYCSLTCAQRAYKQRAKQEKIKAAQLETETLKAKTKGKKKVSKASKIKLNKNSKNSGEITTDEQNAVFLESEIINDVMSVGEAADFLNVSNRTIYNMIKSGNLKAYNINKRLTRIKRESVEQLLTFDLKQTERSETFEEEDVYTISDIHQKFNLTQSFVYHKLKEFKVPKKQKGKNVIVPKKLVDLIFKNHQ